MQILAFLHYEHPNEQSTHPVFGLKYFPAGQSIGGKTDCSQIPLVVI